MLVHMNQLLYCAPYRTPMGHEKGTSHRGISLHIGSACGLAEQSRTHKRKVVSSRPVSANVFVSLGKILNLACLVDPCDIWVAVMGDVTIQCPIGCARWPVAA